MEMRSWRNNTVILLNLTQANAYFRCIGRVNGEHVQYGQVYCFTVEAWNALPLI